MVSLVPITAASRGTLENLMQLYVHDWSELLPLEVGADGRFAAPSLDEYFGAADHHAFIIEVDGQVAGFVLVVARSRLSGAAGTHDLAEFFIMRRHRRQGVGLAAAAAAFARFPGRWEVRQRDENPTATAFWRRAIDRFTGGRYEERRRDDESWTGLVQTFSSTPPIADARH